MEFKSILHVCRIALSALFFIHEVTDALDWLALLWCHPSDALKLQLAKDLYSFSVSVCTDDVSFYDLICLADWCQWLRNMAEWSLFLENWTSVSSLWAPCCPSCLTMWVATAFIFTYSAMLFLPHHQHLISTALVHEPRSIKSNKIPGNARLIIWLVNSSFSPQNDQLYWGWKNCVNTVMSGFLI